MIDRLLKRQLLKRWGDRKVLIVLGPRQVGKTTLINGICKEKGEFLFLDGDQSVDRVHLEDQNLESLKQLIGNYKTIFIDEAQRIVNIGLTLKIIHDQITDVKVIVSGSSSLDLASEIIEPLTGRKWEFNMYPISWKELTDSVGFLNARKQLNTRLIYGMYPEVVNNLGEEEEVLKELASSYLYKDLLTYKGIRKPDLLNKLLKALALQVGSEVSFNELSSLLGVSKETIATYIDLLEKAFIVFKLQPLSRNPRKEISTSRKIYFYDNGIRNAILGEFRPLELRTDVGVLWENFMISEWQKLIEYSRINAGTYFWRTYAQQEIDLILEENGEYMAYEFKWNPRKAKNLPKTFMDFYNPSKSETIHPDNFANYLLYED